MTDMERNLIEELLACGIVVTLSGALLLRIAAVRLFLRGSGLV